jgi:RNA polymerase sigma-70 factor (ECF subfamily)
MGDGRAARPVPRCAHTICGEYAVQNELTGNLRSLDGLRKEFGVLASLEARVAEGAINPADERDTATLRDEFVRLAGRHLDGAFKLAGYLLGDAAEAEDAMQEALARAWRAWPQMREPDSVGPWLDRIVANVCKTRIRKRKGVRSVAFDDELEVVAADPFRAALARDTVGRALERLSPEQRVVVVLRYWRDMPLEQIATRLDIPLGTVKSRLYYALRLLGREIDR